MRVYLAGSARNSVAFHHTRDALTHAGHEVHDWTTGPSAYTWAEVGVGDVDVCSVEQMTHAKYAEKLWDGLIADLDAMDEADVFVLLLPAGNDAHFELGYYAAKHEDRPMFVLAPTGHLRASQFYAMADGIFTGVEELLGRLG